MKKEVEIINKTTFIKTPTRIDGERVFLELPKKIIDDNEVTKETRMKCEILEE